jgi:hypothetical protein
MRILFVIVLAVATIGVVGVHAWLLGPHVSSRTFWPGPRLRTGPRGEPRSTGEDPSDQPAPDPTSRRG